MVEKEAEESPAEWTTFQFKGGLKEYVQYLNRDKNALHDVITFEGEKDGVKVCFSSYLGPRCCAMSGTLLLVLLFALQWARGVAIGP